MVSISEELFSTSLILIVDDDPINSAVINNALSDKYKTHIASSGEEALAFCVHTQPDLILLDVVMDGISGLETCRQLKSNPDTQNIPVVFITSILDVEGEINCWNAGCVDFVSKPVNSITLINRVKAHLTNKLQADLLHKMSYIDGLTGLNNRNVLNEVIEKEILSSNRSGNPLSVLMIDVDWFKRYNDTYGHLQGDECLIQIANTIKQTIKRPNDVNVRFGGEEFLCVLPETNQAGAKYLATGLLKAIESLAIPHKGSTSGIVSISVGGFTRQPNSNLNQRDILNLADQALYKAKQFGRNRYYHESVDGE